MTADVPAARRLRLTEHEAVVLADIIGIHWPADFVRSLTVVSPTNPASRDDEASPGSAAGPGREQVIETLVERRVLERSNGSIRATRSIAKNVEVLFAAPAHVLALGERGGATMRALYAVNSPLGASLLLLKDWGLELSLFAGSTIAAELPRALLPPPEADTTTAAPTPGAADKPATEQRREAASQPSDVISGRLPFAALLGEPLATNLGRPLPVSMTEAEQELAQRIDTECDGQTTFLVYGPGGANARSIHVAPHLWLSSGSGWIGVERVSSTAAERSADYGIVVEIRPVSAADLGAWLSADLAAIIDGQSRGGAA